MSAGDERGVLVWSLSQSVWCLVLDGRHHVGHHAAFWHFRMFNSLQSSRISSNEPCSCRRFNALIVTWRFAVRKMKVQHSPSLPWCVVALAASWLQHHCLNTNYSSYSLQSCLKASKYRALTFFSQILLKYCLNVSNFIETNKYSLPSINIAITAWLMTLAAPSVGDWTRPGGFLGQVLNMDQTLQGAQEQTSSWSIFRALLWCPWARCYPPRILVKAACLLISNLFKCNWNSIKCGIKYFFYIDNLFDVNIYLKILVLFRFLL